MEQEEYTREQINWSYIEFVDNQDVLDLIEKVWVGHYNMCYLVVSKPRNFFLYVKLTSCYFAIIYDLWASLLTIVNLLAPSAAAVTAE